MRLRMRIVSLAAVAVIAGGVASCAPAVGAQDAEKMLNWGFRLRPRALR